MKLLETKTQIIQQPDGLEGVYKQIEYVGRSCWMSQNMIKEDSAISFVKNLQEKGHTAPFERGTIYLKASYKTYPEIDENLTEVISLKDKYKANPYSKVKVNKNSNSSNEHEVYITTNYRVIVENNWFDDLQYMVPFDKEHHEPRITFHFVCQRAISAEYNRHRHNSPMESSSRYCNFANDKYGKEISLCVSDWLVKEAEEVVIQKYFHKPSGIEAIESCNKGLEQYCYEVGNGYDIQNMNIIDYWLFANLACEYSYINMIRLGAKAEQAREVLPLDLKTELYHTAFLDDWLHFCSLRAWNSKGNHPHPEAKKLAEQVFEMLKSLGFVTEDFRTAREVKE